MKKKFALAVFCLLFFLPSFAQQVADSAFVRYREGFRYVEPDYCNNREELDRISRAVRRAVTDGTIDKLEIRTYASPDGTDKANAILTQRRVDSLYSYLVNRLEIPGNLVEARSCGIAWTQLQKMISSSDMQYRDEVLAVFDNTSISLNEGKGRIVSERKRRLMNLRGGLPYAYMKRNFFPELRHGIAIVLYLKSVGIKPQLDTLSTPEPPALAAKMRTTLDTERYFTSQFASAPQMPVSRMRSFEPVPEYYHWAVKTNAAYLAATVANLGLEYSFGKHFSVDLPVNYSPYTVARKYRMRFLTAQPEFRYWLKTPTKGHFFGAHLNIGVFNVSVDDKCRYQSPDGFYGVGISYGYSLPFAKHWAAEFTLGAGYIHTKYDTYYNIPDGARFEKAVPYNYWGLTKVGINIVYRFGK